MESKNEGGGVGMTGKEAKKGGRMEGGIVVRKK